jgi:hypothetical protein
MVPVPKPQGPDIDMNLDPELTGIPHPEPGPEQPMRSNLRLFPPPLFSRQAVPQSYKFVDIPGISSPTLMHLCLASNPIPHPSCQPL